MIFFFFGPKCQTNFLLYKMVYSIFSFVNSGVFKIDTEVLMLDAHLSSKACERVRELSASLQSVVEVKKLPRSQAWPKSWKSFGPTDDNIGLFFFPNSSRCVCVSYCLLFSCLM